MAAYLLVSENVTTNLTLSLLNDLNIGLHTLGRERFSEEIVDVRVRVETSELHETVCQLS